MGWGHRRIVGSVLDTEGMDTRWSRVRASRAGLVLYRLSRPGGMASNRIDGI